MKNLLIAIALLAGSSGAIAQTGVSINIGQPGFYGRIDIGDFGRPDVVYAQPVIIQRPTRYVAEPMYLRVPPGHMKKWGKHCASYNACGRQVYFVRDEWYTNSYAPRYREMRGGPRGDDRRDDRRDERRDDRGDDRGHGKHDKHDKKDKGHGKHRD
jgi:hypothetical protein